MAAKMDWSLSTVTDTALAVFEAWQENLPAAQYKHAFAL
jgi:hypothetical protein